MATAEVSDSNHPWRILHLASSGRWTGAAEPATMLALEQQNQGHAVLFGCVEGGSFARRLEELGLTQAKGFNFDRRLHPGHLLGDLRHLREIIRKFRPDIIHCHLPHDHWTAALALRKPLAGRSRVALVRTMHRETAPRTDLAHRWLVGKGADMVIAISQSQRKRLIEEVGLPTPRVAWVRGSVDLEKFRPGLPAEQIRDLHRIPRDARVAGLIARMQPNRGHHFFLDTLEKVVAAVPQAFYAVAGRGEIKDELVMRIRKHPLKKHLRRLGYRKFDLPETYAAMNAVVLITPGSDGSGRAMLEAMACARPVIGSNMGSIADTVCNGETGYLFRPGDREDLTRVLIEALDNPERLRCMGEQARQYVETHHSRTAQAEAVLQVYQEAVARRQKLVGLR